MKSFKYSTDKLGKKSVFVGGIALVILAVIVFNALISAWFSGSFLFTDLSPESKYKVNEGGGYVTKSTSMFTLMDETKRFLKQTFDMANEKRGEDNPLSVKIIFCADPDLLMKDSQMMYVYCTALALQKAFPDTIEVSAVNVWTNPSAVDDYRTTSYSAIYPTNIIVASGKEFRINTISTFYVTNSAGAEPWAYNGEKKFVSNILAVTKAEAPICCLTTNHGEPIMDEEYSVFRETIAGAGYRVMELDLNREEIPADCRLIITFGPKTDFFADYRNSQAVSEVKKLDEFLGNAYSFMIFADADTPKLPVLEEYLEEWGISFAHYDENANYLVTDQKQSLDGNTWLVGQYEDAALGGIITSDLRSLGNSPKVIFDNAMPIRYSKTYEESYVLADEEIDKKGYTYAKYFSNGKNRNMYDLFRSGKDAVAYAVSNGEILNDTEGNPILDSTGNFRLMSVTMEKRTVSEGQGYTSVNNASYVCAVGSLKIASNQMLEPDIGSTNAYGNTDLLLSVLRYIGQEVEPNGLNWKTLHDNEIDTESYTQGWAVGWTVALVILPVFLLTSCGIFVLVRRKFSRSGVSTAQK